MTSQLSQTLNRIYTSKKLPWVIISIGIALRLIRYLYNPSLYFDESDIAIDIIRTPFSEIILPSPDYAKTYPYLFIMLIKLLTHIFGNSEYVLRFFPLLSGIASLFLFYHVAKHFIDGKAMIIALGLFAVLDPLVFESSNLKPYSSDIFFTLLIYTLGLYIQSRSLNIPRIILFGVSGACIVWFSNPSVFVLAAWGACLWTFSLSKKEWSKSWKLFIVYSVWVISFITNYFLYLRNIQMSFNVSMKKLLLMENAYMPFPPKSLADIKWYIDLFFSLFNYPVGMTLFGISVLAFLIGCSSMYSKKKINFFLLISPLLVTFLAAALHEYIFRGRFILFFLPSILLIIAEGAEYIRSKTIGSSKIIAVIFLSLLFFHPLTTSAYRIIKPFYYEQIRPVLKYVKNNWQKGDVLYVHYFAQYPFDYYSKYYPQPYKFDESEYIIGIAPRGWYRHWRKKDVSTYYGPEVPIEQSSFEIFKIYENDLDQLKGKKRVWVLFTRYTPKDGIVEEKFFIYHLDTIGTRLDFYGSSGVSDVYLYDLSDIPSNKRN